MAEGDITDVGYSDMNLDGATITPEPQGQVLPDVGVSEDDASTKAFAYTELTKEQAPTEEKDRTYKRVRDSILLYGQSPEVTEFEENHTSQKQNKHGANTIQGLTLGSINQEQAISSLQAAVKAGKIPVEDALLIQAGEQADDDPTLLEDEENYIAPRYDYEQWVKDRNNSRDEVDYALSPIIAGIDPSVGSLLVDFTAEAGIPFALSWFSSKLAADIQQDYNGGGMLDTLVARVKGFALPGEVRNDIRKLLMNVSEADRPKLAKELAISIRDNSGIILDNDTETIDWIETVVSSADENRIGYDWDRTLYNLIAVADAIPFVSRIGRSGTLATRSWFSAAAKINRTKARKYFADALGADSNAGILATPEQLVASQLPKPLLKDVDSIPSVIINNTDNIRAGQQVIKSVDNTAINFTETEVSAAAAKLSSAYQALKGGHLNINKFVIDASDGDRIAVDAFYTRTANEGGWKTTLGALKAAEKLTNGDLTGVRILARNIDGGFDEVVTGRELRQLATGKSEGMEYFVQIKRDHFLGESDLMGFGGQPVFVTGPAGYGGRYLAEPTGQFSREIWEPSFKALGTEKEFERSALKLANDFWGLSRGSRNKVTKILEQGAADKKAYTPSELMALEPNMTVGEMKGYYAFRNANDAVWATANNRVYKEMSSQNYRQMSTPDEKNSWITREYKPTDGPINRAYNPKTGKIEDVSPKQIEQLEKAGGGVRRLHSNDPIIRGDEDTLFIINDTAHTKMHPLPRNLLKYEDGYITRINKDNFFVSRGDPVLRNGEKTTRDTIAFTARTQKEAEDIAAELSASTGIEHRVTDTLIDSNYSKVVNDTLLLEQNRLVFGKRAEEPLSRVDGTASPLADPVEALHRAVTATGRAIGIEDYITKQERRFAISFKDVIDSNKWHKYITNVLGPDAITTDLKLKRAGSGAEAKRAAEALNLWQYYQMLRGTASPAALRGWRKTMRTLAYTAEKITKSTSVGAMIQSAAHFDPFAFIKGLVFTTLITANPLRQLALQTSQFSFMVGSNPRIAVASLRHAPVIRVGYGLIDTPHWEGWRKGMSKALHLSEDEVETLVREFKKSGLVAEIDSYGYIGQAVTDPSFKYRPSAFGQAGQVIGNAVKAPFNLAKKLGFNAGEMNNLSLTWTFALKEYVKKTGKTVKDLKPLDWQKIGAQASGYALSMHKAGSLAYQQGFLSMITQFWSIGHKALSAMAPAAWGGSRAFTGSQKAGIAAFQLSLYGGAGLGISELVRDVLASQGALDDVPEEEATQIVNIASSGLGEWALNYILSEATGDDVGLAFSDSFAPGSAGVSNVTDFLMTMMDMGVKSAFLEGTAGGSTIGRYYDMYKFLDTVWDMDTPMPNTPSKLERVMAVTPTVFSGWNNATKAFYGMRTGQLMTQYGDHRTNITYTEAVLKGLFGVSTHEEVDLRRLYSLDGDAFNFNENVAEAIAGDIYKAMNKTMQVFEARGDYDFNRIALALEGEAVILSLADDNQREQIRSAFLKLAQKKRGTPDDVFARIIKMAQEGAVTPDRVYSEVRTNLFAEKYAPQREATLNILRDMIEGRNERAEWLLEYNRDTPTELPWMFDDEEED